MADETISASTGALLKTAFATCAITVFWVAPSGIPIRSSVCSATRTSVSRASQVMDANMVIEMTPSRSNVVAAFFDLGCWNAGTPLLIASTPVSAVVPEVNARATRYARASPVKLPSATTSQSALSAWSSAPESEPHDRPPHHHEDRHHEEVRRDRERRP